MKKGIVLFLVMQHFVGCAMLPSSAGSIQENSRDEERPLLPSRQNPPRTETPPRVKRVLNSLSGARESWYHTVDEVGSSSVDSSEVEPSGCCRGCGTNCLIGTFSGMLVLMFPAGYLLSLYMKKAAHSH